MVLVCYLPHALPRLFLPPINLEPLRQRVDDGARGLLLHPPVQIVLHRLKGEEKRTKQTGLTSEMRRKKNEFAFTRYCHYQY